MRRETRDPIVPEGLVVVGEFGRPHGLSGEIRLKSHTGDPLAIARYGALASPDGRSFTLTQARQAAGDQPDLLVVRVKGVTSREAAEALNRLLVCVPRERIPPPEDEDEFLLADLIGLSATDPDGAPVGTIVAVPNYGGGDLLEIRLEGARRTELVPFTKAFAPVVDLAGRRVVVVLPVTVEGEEAEPPKPGP